MPDYRLYYLTEAGHIFQAVELECESDAQAIEIAGRLASPHGTELWRRNRRIQVFAARSPSHDAPNSGQDAP